ncbi:YybH family protein [Tautonia sociabilis]|nr:SgcJ/EcaC family oxidoreductase [Tautonia sociabilis]
MATPEPSRPRREPVAPILLGSLLWGVGAPSTAQEPAPPASQVEQALRDFNAAFVAAYNRADAPALAAMYADDAEVFETDGARYEGRSLIERSYAELFEAEPGARIELSPEHVRLLSPEVVKEEGRSVVLPADGPPIRRFYTALYVKRDGHWLLVSVREEADPLPAPRDRLRELAWLVGEWVDEGPESEARVECQWSPDGHFLLREATIRQAGEVVHRVSQRIGWDPIAGAFRSWEFDSEGGFGEATWERDGNRWVISESGVSPDGLAASSIRILERIGPDQVRWTRTGLTIDGEEISGEERSVLSRVPPHPGLGDEAPPSSAPTRPTSPSHAERSPR